MKILIINNLRMKELKLIRISKRVKFSSLINKDYQLIKN